MQGALCLLKGIFDNTVEPETQLLNIIIYTHFVLSSLTM